MKELIEKYTALREESIKKGYEAKQEFDSKGDCEDYARAMLEFERAALLRDVISDLENIR